MNLVKIVLSIISTIKFNYEYICQKYYKSIETF